MADKGELDSLNLEYSERRQLSLQIQIDKASEMNVYIYEGKSRHKARKSLVPMNKMPILGRPYSVDLDSGILIVAYPNKDVDTEF